jgi:hypothetical protein
MVISILLPLARFGAISAAPVGKPDHNPGY